MISELLSAFDTNTPVSDGAPDLVSEGGSETTFAEKRVTFEDPPLIQASEGEKSSISPDSSPSDLILEYINLESSGALRSSRVRKVTAKVAETYDAATRKMYALFSELQFVGLTTLTSKLEEAHSDLNKATDLASEPSTSVFITACNIFHRLNSHFDCTLNVFSTFAFASAKHNDTYTFKEMMQQPDKGKIMEAMEKEVDDYLERKHWSMIRRSQMPDLQFGVSSEKDCRIER